MLNFANNADVRGNLVRGGTHEKCTFIYNAHRNLIHGNRFEGCEIGIHFTAGSERNAIFGNAFIGNRNQVKYVGTRDIEWSHEGAATTGPTTRPSTSTATASPMALPPQRPDGPHPVVATRRRAADRLARRAADPLEQANFPATLPGGVLTATR
jgi:nitrous oxidase accessory protein